MPTENAETPPVDRPDDTTRRRDWNVWNWVERIAMVSAVAFTAAGIGATAWLLSADGDDATAARTDGADLERFETAAGARMPSQVAVVPRTTIADAAKMAAVAALTPPAVPPPHQRRHHQTSRRRRSGGPFHGQPRWLLFRLWRSM